jgi:hypothetical protein
MARSRFTRAEAEEIGRKLGVDWDNNPFDVDEFRLGLDIELEHGMRNPATNITDDDPVMTGKITLAHLNEIPTYNTRLTIMERQAKK